VFSVPPKDGTFQLRSLANIPAPREVVVSGCTAVEVDPRLCKRSPPRVRIGGISYPTDGKGCFKHAVPARQALLVQVDTGSAIDACKATNAMRETGGYPCAFPDPITVPLQPGIVAYQADVELKQTVCEDP
jgi:hypothetical protein